MTVVFKAPVLLPLIFGAVLVVTVAAVFLKKMPLWKRITAVVIAVAVCGVLLLLFWHDTSLVVDAQGIRADTYGKASVTWAEVEKATLVQPLKGSPYELTMRTGGVGLPGFQAGWFKLANGLTAFVTIQDSDGALVLDAAGKTYVFGPHDLDAFVTEVARHVTVAGANPKE